MPDRTTPRDDAPDAESPASRRRPFLKSLSGSAITAALAGCPFPGDDAGSDGEPTVPDRVDLQAMAEGDSAAFGGVVRFSDAYAMDAVTRDPDGAEVHTTGRFDGSDHALEIETDDAAFESYVVADDAYQVRDGQCYRYPGVAAGLSEGGDATDDAAAAASSPELTRVGTETVDGEETAVLELPAGELEAFDEALTYYVTVETGYLRRLEGGFGTVDYGSWGDVSPIDPPDGDCPVVE